MNERTILPDKSKLGAREPYLIISHNDLNEACRRLNGGALKVYLYLAKNGIEWKYLPESIAYTTGISNETARTAFKELVEEGYLTSVGGDRYQFHKKAQESAPTANEPIYTFIFDDKEYKMVKNDIYRFFKQEGYNEAEINEAFQQIMEENR